MTKAEVTEYLVTHRGMPREALSVFVAFGDRYRLYSDGIDIHSASQEILANLASGRWPKYVTLSALDMAHSLMVDDGLAERWEKLQSTLLLFNYLESCGFRLSEEPNDYRW